MAQRSVIYLEDDLFEIERMNQKFSSAPLKDKFYLQTCSSLTDFTALLRVSPAPDIFLLDVHLGEDDSVSLIPNLRKSYPQSMVLMYSSDIQSVRKSLKAGADDFVLKSKSLDEVVCRLENLIQRRDGRREVTSPLLSFPIIGSTMQRIEQKLQKLVSSAVRTVFIHAESGSGKEVVASMIKHHAGQNVPFFAMNCAALSPQMLESELFGHVKGSFTGALADRKGFLESASGGWLFMDEVANLTMAAQGSLLRAIDNQEIIRLGESKVRTIDTKIVCATNESLAEKVKAGTFRNDLWQRLKEIWIEIPPIRERLDEVSDFVQYFARTADGGPYLVQEGVLQILKSLRWEQGNVRAIRNCVRAMTASHTDKVLTLAALPEWVWEEYDKRHTVISSSPSPVTANSLILDLSQDTGFPTLERLHDRVLLGALKILCSDGRQSYRGVAKTLGIPRSTLFNRLKRLNEAGLVSKEELGRYFGEPLESLRGDA